MDHIKIPLVVTHEEDGGVFKEVRKQLWLAGPLICVSLLQYSLQLVSIMFVGHLGELSLSGASMATSFATVTAFSLFMGMASALDTLCGQSYGAKQYHMLGVYMQRAMLIITVVSIPLAIVWVNTGSILKAVGQDPDIAEEAEVYARFMLPSLFAYGLLQCLVRFLQTQNIVFVMMMSSGTASLIHILVCWILVFKLELGSKGAALANSISYWNNVILLALYVKFSSACRKTWTGFSREAFHDILAFIKLAIPSAVMVCTNKLVDGVPYGGPHQLIRVPHLRTHTQAIYLFLLIVLEMWSFEMIVLLSGLLPNPKLETSVLSICLNTTAVMWMIPFGLSGAVSTRVSNELGAGHPRTARLSVMVVLVVVIILGILVGSVLMLIRNIWGYAFSNEVEVVEYVAAMTPILATSNFMDGIMTVLSRFVRGCGSQEIGAYINLGSYYLIGIPFAVLLAFVLHVGGRGLWFGIITALMVQVISLLIVTIRTNWDAEAMKARERVHESALPIEIVS